MDYAKTDWPWTMFDPAAKQQRHETVFQEERKKAFRLGWLWPNDPLPVGGIPCL